MSIVDRADLYCKSGSKDAVYHLQLVQVEDGYVVNYQNGRAGGSLASGTKSPKGPGTLELARKTFDKVLREKLTASPPYQPMAAASDSLTVVALAQSVADARTLTGLEPQLLNEVPREHVEGLLRGDAWLAQQKVDGERRMVRSCEIDGGTWAVIGSNRKGVQVPVFAEVAAALSGLDCELDAEDVGGHLHVFDLLRVNGRDIRHLGAEQRMRALEEWFTRALRPRDPQGRAFQLVATARNEAEKRALLAQTERMGQEGVVFKKADAPYAPGRPGTGGDQLKLKHWADATCEVMGHSDAKRSVLLGLRREPHGELVAVGNVTIPPSDPIPPLGALVEVRYLYAFEGGSLFQPVFRGIRDDVTRDEALLAQLKFKRAHESALVGALDAPASDLEDQAGDVEECGESTPYERARRGG